MGVSRLKSVQRMVCGGLEMYGRLPSGLEIMMKNLSRKFCVPLAPESSTLLNWTRGNLGRIGEGLERVRCLRKFASSFRAWSELSYSARRLRGIGTSMLSARVCRCASLCFKMWRQEATKVTLNPKP